MIGFAIQLRIISSELVGSVSSSPTGVLKMKYSANWAAIFAQNYVVESFNDNKN